MRKIAYLALVVIAFVAGWFIHPLWFAQTASLLKDNQQTAAKPAENKPLYWVAPMDPNYKRDRPGKSPMGMDLVPVYAKDKKEQTKGIEVASHVQQSLGVQTVKVEYQNLTQPIHTVGFVEPDETRISHIHTYMEGWIKELNTQKTGEQVKKGQLLYELYSLPLVNAQHEFLLALQHNDKTLINAGHNKLLALGVSEQQIQEIKRTKKVMQLVKVYAPHDGVISKLNIREGMYVKPEQAVMSIEDLSQVWVIAHVFEKQVPWLKLGDIASVSLPNQVQAIQAKVDYIYPHVDSMTRTVRVRLVVSTPNFQLTPNNYVDVTINTHSKQHVLAIPRSAVIDTGQGPRVIVQSDKQDFIAKAIKTGLENQTNVEILKGLKAGDKVVTQAQFLLDSELNLQAGLERLSAPENEMPPSKPMPKNHHHQHHHH